MSYFCGTMRLRTTHPENGEQILIPKLWNLHFHQRLAHCVPQAKHCLPSIFVNKVLWEHGHVHSFTDCL